MNIDDKEMYGRDEPNFQDENKYDDTDINRQFNDQRNDIDDDEDEDDDLDDLDEDIRNDEEDYDDVDDDDLEEDGDLDDDDDDDLEETDRPGDLYKDVDLSLQDEINQDREEVDPVTHQRKF
jgi:hypothetical protein